MKVKDMIKELKRLNPETEVYIEKRDMEQGLVVKPLSIFNVNGFKCKEVKKQFRDAFDGTRYKSTIIQTNSLGMLEKFILTIY